MKTFKEILQNDPDIYSGIEIDNATKNTIFDWFQFREVCDDTRFRDYFRRMLRITSRRYSQLLRIELTEFDPMVASYYEEETRHEFNANGTGSTTGSASGTEKTTGGTVTDYNAKNNSTSGTETHGTENGTTYDDRTEHTTNNTDSKTGAKSQPQAIAYESTPAGKLPAFDWQYLSTQGQSETGATNDGKSTANGRDERNTTGRTIGTAGGESESKTTTTNSGGKTTDSKNATSSTNAQHEDSTDRKITSGRSGLTPQEALTKARDYIMISNAFAFLRLQLEPCFMAIYDF